MLDNVNQLLNTLLAFRSRIATECECPSDSERQTISLQLWPVLVRISKSVMSGSTGGFNIFDPMDLAASVLEKLVYSNRPGILKFEGGSEGELINFLKTTLRFALIDDQRKLVGRSKKNAVAEEFVPQDLSSYQKYEAQTEQWSEILDHRDVTEFEAKNMTNDLQTNVHIDTFVPRVFVHEADPDGNEFIRSERRTATGYLLLKQTRKHLEEYLEQIPGSMVLVPYGQRSQKQGYRRVTLTQEHAELLRLWMSGEGDDHWLDIALQLKRPLGTVKRWWAEAVVAFQSDSSPSACALRDLYRLNPVHFHKAREGMEVM